MKNFDWTQFTRKIAIKAPLNALYDAWTIPAQIERWFLSDATFYNSSGEKIDKNEHITSGSRYEWQWYLWDPTETGVVKEVNGTDHIQFTFAGECIVDVHLESFKDNTIVSISQREIPTTDEHKVNIHLGCDRGWSFYLVNLKSIYEGGIDLRNKNSDLKPMLNT
ncbi:MAG: SRPBCC domain-containing protein [Flavobacteriaceae bacterium]|nr:SRPBCC domain-containing protein [Flavobacteriaceae bacterium]